MSYNNTFSFLSLKETLIRLFHFAQVFKSYLFFFFLIKISLTNYKLFNVSLKRRKSSYSLQNYTHHRILRSMYTLPQNKYTYFTSIEKHDDRR